MEWFDAHLDLACLAQCGRDLTADLADCGGPFPPAVTFPALRAGGITRALATIFVQPRVLPAPGVPAVDGDWCFGSPEEAFNASLGQCTLYQRWNDAGLVALGPAAPATTGDAPLRVQLLLEGAAGVRTPDDLALFKQYGVQVVGLTWAVGSQYAGGDRTGGDITAAGRALVARIDQLGMMHDVAHLSERAFWSLLELTSGVILSSHSNCRTLLPGAATPERHLTDTQIRALGQRNATFGINLYSKFLAVGCRATIRDVVNHAQHISQLLGRRDCIGLGSDMDGGFAADQLPEGLDACEKLAALADALHSAGWTDAEVEGFASANWQRTLGQ